MLANRVTSADTGKYKTSQTHAKSPWGMYLMRWIEARAAETQSAAEEKTRGFSGRVLSPWMAYSDKRLVQ